MKNSIKLITWLVGGLFTFSSCTDLDVDLKSTYTEYPDSEIATEARYLLELSKKNVFLDIQQIEWQVCIMDSAEH